MVYGDINMNIVYNVDGKPCVNPAALMANSIRLSNTVVDEASTNSRPTIEDANGDGAPSTDPEIIRCKLYFLIAAHKTVQTGKEFVAVARITRNKENPFVDAQARAYHYIPEGKHRQFNTSTPLTENEMASAVCDDRVFVVHKKVGTSWCVSKPFMPIPRAPAGTYLVYRLKRFDPGLRHLRFEASWDWGDGVIGKASYDFVFLKAQDSCKMKPYTAIQMRLLSELWPEWQDHLEC
ncbi:hypothetical protein NUW58_g902 [Xylaria curta]|uniref:Uncharacterized protein n=1 Tax=Xylaria curta TaxID=42375 RepID=A0ACC1PNH1_9PEZI|nr:hypothetical protein NUW58_g902 [Xylaria curta]